ncbi:MAG: PBP1A family penicillin-binding protein [Clostridiales bacterium]|nr:PBP1A family penicillin-binding protein [Clostridiales bacterium]
MSQNKTPERQSNNKKKKGQKSRFKKFLLFFVIFIFLIGFAAAGTAVGLVVGIIKDMPPIDASNIYDLLDESSFILDSDGEIIEKVQTAGYRAVVDYSQLPDHLIDAFIAIEDERFFDHNGLDIKRIFGAAWTNFRTGSRQGASTISQQLAKNLYLTHEQTYTRKIRDMYYAIQLEKQLSKEQILEAYLNTINLGSGAYGVQAAAHVYFSKDVSELTIGEAALIAGIARNPSRYSPMSTLEKDQVDEEKHIILDDRDLIYTIVYNDNYKTRQKLVLNNMKRLGKITEQEYEDALNEDILSQLKPNRFAQEERSSYFGDLVKDEVIDLLVKHGHSKEKANEMLYSGGLRIYSTMDARIQKILDEEYENQNNFTDLQGRPLLIVGEDGNVQPQSAMVIIEQETGKIRGIVGGRNIKGRKIYNRALNPRQPGSAIKPIAVYTPAIDLGFTAASIIDDIPVYFDRGNPSNLYPNNYDHRYRGLITVREALRHSSNIGAVVMANMLSNNNDNASFNIMFDYMEKLGISTVVRPENPYVSSNGKKFSDATYSTALGGMTHGVSPLEMATAFATLGNQGVYIKPTTITEIRDSSGNIIIENIPNKNQVVSPDVAYVMTDMLQNVVTSGTGTSARLDNRQIPVAGKTGTTNNQKDAWFVGYTPYYTAATWVGYDTPDKLPGGGARMAGTLWKKIMQRIHEDFEPKQFPASDNIIRKSICNVSGKLPTEFCSLDPRGSRIQSEMFIKGTEPTEYCTTHVQVDIHVPTGKIATEHTPPWEVEPRVFIQRPIPYDPSAHGGRVPADYAYEVPKEYYDPLEDGGLPPFGDDSIDGSTDNNMEEPPIDDYDPNSNNGNSVNNNNSNENENGNSNGNANNILDDILSNIIN